MRCSACGALNRPGVRFCTSCGAVLTAAANGAAARTSPTVAAAGVPSIAPAAGVPSSAPPAAAPPAGALARVWRVIEHEPTGLAQAAVIFVLGAAFSWLLWRPLSLPSQRAAALVRFPQCGAIARASTAEVDRCATQVGYLSYAGPVVLMLFFAVLGLVLHFMLKVVVPRLPGRLHPSPSVGLLLPPLVATLLFAMSWSGMYAGQVGTSGYLPQPVFPAIAGLFAFATIRWGPFVQSALDRLLALRDRVHLLIRLGLTILVPYLFTQWASVAKNAPPAGRREQAAVLIGFAVSYLLLAPRRPPVTALDDDLLADLGISVEQPAGRTA